MKVDRLPDNPDDPRPDARDPRPDARDPRPDAESTDSPAPEDPAPPVPEHHPRPERAPGQERKPDQEQRPDTRQNPASEHPPESSPTQTDSPLNTPARAEPRSRQEHATPLPVDEQKTPAEAEGEDRDTRVAAETDAVPDGQWALDDIAVQKEAQQDLGEARSAEEPTPDDLPREEDTTTDDIAASETSERPNAGSPDQEDHLSERADAPPPVHDKPPPLTDKEWSEHVTEVRDTLDKARAAGLETHLMYTIDPDHQAWSKDRRTVHDTIINDLYSAARDIPNQGYAVVAGGLGGAGKTTVLGNHAGIDPAKYLTINPDDIKEELAQRGMVPGIDGLSPMEASDLVHEESSYLARQLALRAHRDGKNIIWDITMSTQKSTEKRISDLREAGYSRIDGLFVNIPVGTSIERTEARHRLGHDQYRAGEGLGGRYIPPEVIQRQTDSEWDSKNRRTFDSLTHRFNDWSIYDNSIDGRRAVLRESSSGGEVDPSEEQIHER